VICDGQHTLVMTGEVGLASRVVLDAALAHICTDPTTAVVLDMRKVTFIDSCGIQAVLTAEALCKQHGCEFTLIPGQPQVQRVFEISGLLHHLPFRDDESRADPDLSGGDSKAGAASGRLAADDLPPRHLREPMSGSDPAQSGVAPDRLAARR
jgi:anti-sigma B factor antagonist